MKKDLIELKVRRAGGPEATITAEPASGFLQKFLGLMFRKRPAGFGAMLLSGCSSIHTFFMRFSIDVVCIDSKNTVCDIHPRLRPWKIFIPGRGTKDILEMPAGGIAFHGIRAGDVIEY